MQKQIKQLSQIDQLKAEEQKLVEARKQQPYKIEVKNMPENIRYTKLDMEGKLLTDSETIYPGTELRLIYKLATN